MRRGLLLAGMALGLAGMAAGGLGIVRQVMPRTFSPAQRGQIMAWEVAGRWRTWPAGKIFPPSVTYQLPGNAFGSGPGLRLVARRVGIARQARCAAAAAPATARVLAGHGCVALLRATYTDSTQSMAVTVGVAVLPNARAARTVSAATAGGKGRHPLVRAVRFRHTAAAAFGAKSGRVPWARAAGPYLVLAAAGYADGRPWQGAGGDFYVRAEMLSLAGGVGGAVASRIGAPPAPPHCPGGPAC